jgi:hypothetical protein
VDGEATVALDDPVAPLPPPSVVTLSDADAPLDHTVVDKKRRDEMLARIEQARRDELAAQAQPQATPSAAPDAGRGLYDWQGHLDKTYIQDRMHEDFFPLARQCYTAALERDPTMGGMIELKFSIVGDARVGGVVESASLGDRTTIGEKEMATCMRESMLSMAFAPPEHGGRVEVTYPIVFSPEDDDGGSVEDAGARDGD